MEDAMPTSEEDTTKQAYFTDSYNPWGAMTLEQLDYDNAAFPMGPTDHGAIEALAVGETYEVRFVEEDDDAPRWGTITRIADDTPVRALVWNGTVLGIAFDDAGARERALHEGADPTIVDAGESLDGTLAALSRWNDWDGPEHVGIAPDGRVRSTDGNDIPNEGTARESEARS
jgi:hypothetical protein